MSQRLEIWTIAQKWMTMNENIKKRRKKKTRKGREKDEENEKDENKKLN